MMNQSLICLGLMEEGTYFSNENAGVLKIFDGTA